MTLNQMTEFKETTIDELYEDWANSIIRYTRTFGKHVDRFKSYGYKVK